MLLRLQSGQSQSQLAGRVPSPRTYISKVENGGAIPTLSSFERYARALGVAPEKIMQMCDVLMSRE
jgi:transcriptional regulator with XRE-family HTH domain